MGRYKKEVKFRNNYIYVVTLTAVLECFFLKAALKVSKKCMHNIVTQTAFVLYLADPSDDSSDPSGEGK